MADLEKLEKAEEKESGERFATLKTLWNIFRKCWYWLLLTAVVAGGIVFVIGYTRYVPVYSSNSVFYVSNVANTTSLYSASQTAGAEDMAGIICNFTTADGVVDYIAKHILPSDEALKKAGYVPEYDENGAIKGVRKGDRIITGQTIKKMISTNADSAFFTVKVSDMDSQLALSICHAMEIVLPAYSDWSNNQYVKTVYETKIDEITGNEELLYERLPNSNNYYLIVKEKALRPFEEVMEEVIQKREMEAALGNEVKSSDTIKITSLAIEDSVADNKISLFRYPVLAAFIAAVLLYLIFLFVDFH